MAKFEMPIKFMNHINMENNLKIKKNVIEAFNEANVNKTYLKVCAPMVRYSKIQFRTLVKKFDVDLCFTPMILADSFCQNEKARSNEFSTTISDSPVIVQFAANDVRNFVDASKLVYPYADGVDLNCGCPQRWAIKDGFGCALLSKPEIIYDLVKEVRNNLPNDFSVSVKMRTLKDVKRTVDICKQIEKCGVNFLTIHGRTPSQQSKGSVDMHKLKEVCDSVQIPVVANGGIKTLKDADTLFEFVGCSGVMAASGILTNPALFSGANVTPISCIKMWMELKNKSKDRITFQCYHHHLVFMLEKILTKRQKQFFNYLSTFGSVDEFLYENIISSLDYDMKLECDLDDFVSCEFADEITLKHSSKCRSCSRSICYCTCYKYDCNATEGKFFSSYVKEYDDLDYMDCSIFKE